MSLKLSVTRLGEALRHLSGADDRQLLIGHVWSEGAILKRHVKRRRCARHHMCAVGVQVDIALPLQHAAKFVNTFIIHICSQLDTFYCISIMGNLCRHSA